LPVYWSGPPIGADVLAALGFHAAPTIVVHLADPKVEKAAVEGERRKVEADLGPVRYLAMLIGADADAERTIRWLIALMVLCCDPLAIALTAAASARRSGA
jgi:hypothetical protein